ncbi:MAG: efflux RND transporter periplasmic adaptor subunit [Opitutales bacterium]|nr:efflux RND transporter periplasmic adaptor subunit [Opitutales bacterium]
MKSKIVFLFVISVLAGTPELFAQAQPTVAAGEVVEAVQNVVRRYPGRIVSVSDVPVVSRVSGDLLEVAFKEGDFVERGQLLYRLDDIRYVAAKRAAEAKIAQYKARVSYSKANYERTKHLFEKEVSTQDELDSALAEYEANKALLAAAEADLIVATDDLDNTRIYARSHGRVGVNKMPEGTYVTPASGTLTTIVQFNPIRARFALSNRDFLTIFGDEKTFRETAKISLILANGKEYPLAGTLDFIDNSANASTDTVQVYALFQNDDYVLVPGSTLSVVVSKDCGKSPALVPSAMLYDREGAYVYVLDENNVPARRKITVVNETKDLFFVGEGLKPGERIVIDGTHKVVPGKAVNVIQK